MKRKYLIALLERNGWKAIREGSNHTIFCKGNEKETIHRHREISELLAKTIIKRRDLK